MGAYNRQPLFLICLTIFIVQNLVSSTYFAGVMDWRCHVSFNYTMLKEDGKDNLYSDCYKNITVQEGCKNHTWEELHNCVSKCFMLKSGVFEKPGVFVPSKLTENYVKYSNATSEYISNVAKVMSDCVVKAEEDVQNLTTNGEDVSDCKYFKLFGSCTLKRFVEISHNKTTIQGFCGGDGDNIASTEAGEVIYY